MPSAASPRARESGRDLREERQVRSMDISVHRPAVHVSATCGSTYETSTNRRATPPNASRVRLARRRRGLASLCGDWCRFRASAIRLRRRLACGRIRGEERHGAVWRASGGKIGHFSTLSHKVPFDARMKPQVRGSCDFSAFLLGASRLTETIHRSPFSGRISGKVPDFAQNDPSLRARACRYAIVVFLGRTANEIGGHIGLPTRYPFHVCGCIDLRNLNGSPACCGCSRLAESADRVLALAGRTAIG